MEENIKIIEEFIEAVEEEYEVVREKQSFEKFIKAYKQKDKENNDLRRLYRRTAEKLRENGKEELADYFLAQINEVPTFTVDDDIDYYEEYYKLLSRNKELEEENGKLKEHCKTLTKEKQELTTLALDSIPKSLVEEKIEELDKLIIETQKELGSASKEYTIYVYQKSILQELLKGE